MDKKIVVCGKSPLGYRPMWHGEIIPKTAIFDEGYDGEWQKIVDVTEDEVGEAFNVDEHVPHAVPCNHAPLFEYEEDDEPQEPGVPYGFRRLGMGEEIPYYALVLDGGQFRQIDGEDWIRHLEVGDSDFVIARIIPEGYDVLGWDEEARPDDLYILAGVENDEWEPFGVDGCSINEYWDAVFIRKRLSVEDQIAQYIDEQVALTAKYNELWEKTGLSGDSFVLTEELARIKNAVKG